MTTTWGGLSQETVRVPRAQVGAVRVANEVNTWVLTIDVGIDRRTASTGHTAWGDVTLTRSPCTMPSFAAAPSLAAPEMEWLAERILAWRDEA